MNKSLWCCAKLFIWQQLKLIYKNLPLSEKNKCRVRLFIFKYLSFAIRNTSSYKNWIKNSESIQKIIDYRENIIREINELDLTQGFQFSIAIEPLVSIIIPVHNNIKFTYLCLKSIYNNPCRYNYEIIVMDDCSTDNTQEVLSGITGTRVVRNEKNLGFIRNCNAGASIARGKYLLFLNNDTQVMPHWLDELVDTFKNFPEAGLVGSKLLYLDGQLQEAGALVWKDGSAWNFGRHDDPGKPEYNYLREVDYCSGASIMVPRELFYQAGCFNEMYVPAYCEDADLAFTIRKIGRKVLYQSLSQVIHLEGISHGTDITQGIKAYQVENNVKFYNKWKEVLASHRAGGIKPYLEKERNIKRRLLYIDACTPTPDKDAGSVTAFYLMKLFAELSLKVTFIPMDNFLYCGKYTNDLQRLGIECLYAPYVTSVESHLEEFGSYYDIVVLNIFNFAAACINDVRKYCPRAKIIFNPKDLHFLRLQRQAVIEKSKQLELQAKKAKDIELEIIKKSDATIIVSEEEIKILKEELKKNANLHFIQLILETPGTAIPFEQRKDILYIGGYQHTPNVDAVLYFTDKIWPLIKRKIPDLKFYIIGSNPPKSILALNSDDIKVIGYVQDLRQYFDLCKLSVAPLRYGAGIKGKVGTSMSYGLPCVVTTIAAEGMGLCNDNEILIEDDENKFAQAVESLYHNQILWNKLSLEGLDFVKRKYSLSQSKIKIKKMLIDLGVLEANAEDAANSCRAAVN